MEIKRILNNFAIFALLHKGGIILFFMSHVFLAQSYMVENDTTAMMYLERFGYIEHDDMPPQGMAMKEATPMLMAFQKMCGIDQTGELDNKTVEMMNTPRCGNKDMMRVPLNDPQSENDIDGYPSSSRVQRYTLNQHGLKWTKSKVSYRLAMFSEQMQKSKTVSEKQVLEAIHEAFKMWSEVTNLDFVHKPETGRGEKVDIELTFTSREHPEDGFPFDGPGRVLAHAFPPGQYPLAGDVHFEDEENWHVHSPKGTDVLFVAVHEIGHALGLSHSSTKGAIMAAFYGGYRPKLKLHQDDIDGIQKLYGKREAGRIDTSESRDWPQKILPPKTTVPPYRPPPTTRRTTTTPRTTTTEATTTTRRTTTTTTTPRTTTTPFYKKFDPWKTGAEERWKTPKISSPVGVGRPDLCQDSKIDAITTLNDGKIYVFKGAYVFQISTKGDGVLPGWPNHIGYVFPGLDTNIDAAATRENGKSYFFKGSKYWRFTGTKMDPGYPKMITQHFRGIPDHIDSAFVWFGQFYFTKGDKFWRFDPKTKPHVPEFYPLSTNVWGFRHGVDAAFPSPNGQRDVYFFVGDLYYRLDGGTFKIAVTSPPYPRSSRVSWFGCSNTRTGSSNTITRPDFRTIRKLISAPLVVGESGEYDYSQGEGNDY